MVRRGVSRRALEALYLRMNRRELVPPDPLELLYAYDDVRDREVAGLVASALAYGRASQIQRSAGAVLGTMGEPRGYLERSTARRMRRDLDGFRHRWSTGDEVAALLLGAERAVRRHGSLGDCLASYLSRSGAEGGILAAADAFCRELAAPSGGGCPSLLPRPCRGSACKRLHLYLRWMVRRDAVDPGGWESIPPSLLVVPLDTHMHRLGLALGLTARRSADCRTALEMTRAFARFSPEDPVRYDFALTRLGIRPDESVEAFLRDLG